LKPQRIDRVNQGKIAEILKNVQSKGYIGFGHVSSLTSYFAAPKGLTDIRLVYDASASGLNSVLWAPAFSLPIANTLLDLLTPGVLDEQP
jgi:hypothetical protein